MPYCRRELAVSRACRDAQPSPPSSRHDSRRQRCCHVDAHGFRHQMPSMPPMPALPSLRHLLLILFSLPPSAFIAMPPDAAPCFTPMLPFHAMTPRALPTFTTFMHFDGAAARRAAILRRRRRDIRRSHMIALFVYAPLPTPPPLIFTPRRLSFIADAIAAATHYFRHLIRATLSPRHSGLFH